MDEGLISVFRRDFNGGGWAVFGKGITSGTVILSRLMLTEGFCVWSACAPNWTGLLL